MKRWYLFYYKQVIKGPQLGEEFGIALASKTGDNQDVEIRQQVVDELETANRQQAVDEKGQQVVGQLEIPENFGSK